MSFRPLIFVVVTLSACFANGGSGMNTDSINLEDVMIEINPWEEKILTAISDLKKESIRRLEDMDKKFSDNLEEVISRRLKALEKKLPDNFEEYLEKKFNALANKNHVLEEGISEKLHKLEQNILNKMQEHVDDKLNSIEKHIFRKIDALEKFVPDKTDTNMLGHKIDASKKLLLDLVDNTSNMCESKPMTNVTLAKIEESLTKGFNELKSSILNTRDNKTQTLLNQTSPMGLEDAISGIEIINRKLDMLDKIIPAQVDRENISLRFDALEKKMLDLKQNISSECDQEIFSRHLIVNLTKMASDLDFAEIKQQIPQLGQNVTEIKNELKSLEQSVLAEVYNTQCKKKVAKGSYGKYIEMETETLNHVEYRKDGENVTYFEMHIAVQGDTWVMLSPLSKIVDRNISAYQIGIHQNHIYLHRKDKFVVDKDVPNNLEKNKLTPFYIKIENGTLNFGKEGSNTTLITYSDDGLRSFKYFGFSGTKGNRSYYDCPPRPF